MIDFLLGDSETAFWLRDQFIFKVIPMLNPDGVIRYFEEGGVVL